MCSFTKYLVMPWGYAKKGKKRKGVNHKKEHTTAAINTLGLTVLLCICHTHVQECFHLSDMVAAVPFAVAFGAETRSTYGENQPVSARSKAGVGGGRDYV